MKIAFVFQTKRGSMKIAPPFLFLSFLTRKTEDFSLSFPHFLSISVYVWAFSWLT
jgi:hypothetical protein